MSVGPKFHMGDAVALVAGESQVYLGPVKGFPRKTQFGYEYEVAHGRGGRKLFRVRGTSGRCAGCSERAG